MDQVKIGKYISEKRKLAGLTQEQLADQLNKSRKAVSKWERGICMPEVSCYQDLCRILNITLNELFTGEDIKTDYAAEQSETNLRELLESYVKDHRLSKQKVLSLLVIAIILFAVLMWQLLGSRPHYVSLDDITIHSTSEGFITVDGDYGVYGYEVYDYSGNIISFIYLYQSPKQKLFPSVETTQIANFANEPTEYLDEDERAYKTEYVNKSYYLSKSTVDEYDLIKGALMPASGDHTKYGLFPDLDTMTEISNRTEDLKKTSILIWEQPEKGL